MLTDEPKTIRILKPPAVDLKPSSEKIRWVWYNAADNEYILRGQDSLWAIAASPTEGALKPILIRTAGESSSIEGTSSSIPKENRLTDATLKALISAGVRGFRFLDLAYYQSKYDGSLDRIDNAFMFLSYALCGGLNGRIEVRHPLSDISLLFKDTSVLSLGSGGVKRFSTYTHVHLCHPTQEAFFTGDNAGKVYLHPCEKGSFGKSQPIANIGYPINDLAITADGNNLFIAAMGKLQWFRWKEDAYSMVHEFAGSPRQIVRILDSGLLVNLGIHGICLIATENDSMKVKWRKTLPIPVDVAAVDASFTSMVCIPAGVAKDIVVLRN